MRRLSARIARLPIRVRLTLISAVATAALFGVLALVLYSQFQSSVNTSINSALRARAGELTMLSQALGRPVARAARPAPGTAGAFAQVLAPDGHILDATTGYRRAPLLAVDERRAALVHPLLVDRHERSRLYARRAPDGSLIVVGVTLAQQQDAFITFNWELLAGTPLMVLIASVLTYLVGGKLLAPVERMRRQAALISTEHLDTRLPLPDSVDEIHHLASTLNEMLDRLRAGVARERTFVSDASHELRTPLTVLKGELEVALRIDGSRSDWRRAVGSAVEETDRVIALAESLLLVARAQDGSVPLALRRLDAGELLRRVASRGQLLAGIDAGAGDGELVIDCAPGLTLVADPTWTEQALVNLVHNSLRYGGGEIALTAARVEDRVELHVRDDGPGFPDGFLPRAFERFSRADSSRPRGGAGLGLAIVDTVARAHGGLAHAANRDHGGADVWFSVPGLRHPGAPVPRTGDPVETDPVLPVPV